VVLNLYCPVILIALRSAKENKNDFMILLIIKIDFH